MPDILSRAGRALRVWGVGSEERNAARWDIFLTADYEGGSALFSQIQMKEPYTGILSRALSLCPSVWLCLLCNARLFCLTADWMRFAGDFCVRKYAQSAWSRMSIPMCISFLVLDLIFLLFGIFTRWWYTLAWFWYLAGEYFFSLLTVQCTLATPPPPTHPPSQVVRIGWRWPHPCMCNATRGACYSPYKSSIHYSVGVHVVRDVIRELIAFLLWENECVIMKSSAMNQWDWRRTPSSWVLGVPLIGDHVFVPDRLWNGVLLRGCVTPASHQGDWLVWSCGMFPSGPQ